MGHMGGLINPRPGRGQYRASFSNTGGSPKPRKRATCQKKKKGQFYIIADNLNGIVTYFHIFIFSYFHKNVKDMVARSNQVPLPW